METAIAIERAKFILDTTAALSRSELTACTAMRGGSMFMPQPTPTLHASHVSDRMLGLVQGRETLQDLEDEEPSKTLLEWKVNEKPNS